jgi:hypothetical protein
MLARADDVRFWIKRTSARAKLTTTGTYAGNTAVRIDLVTDGLTAYPCVWGTVSRREDESWKAIGAFVVVCGILVAALIVSNLFGLRCLASAG